MIRIGKQKIVKVIACILSLSMFYQGIAYAAPDILSRDTLQVQTRFTSGKDGLLALATGYYVKFFLDLEEKIDRKNIFKLEDEVKKAVEELSRRKSEIPTKYIDSIPTIVESSQEGEITVKTGAFQIRYYDPTIIGYRRPPDSSYQIMEEKTVNIGKYLTRQILTRKALLAPKIKGENILTLDSAEKEESMPGQQQAAGIGIQATSLKQMMEKIRKSGSKLVKLLDEKLIFPIYKRIGDIIVFSSSVTKNFSLGSVQKPASITIKTKRYLAAVLAMLKLMIAVPAIASTAEDELAKNSKNKVPALTLHLSYNPELTMPMFADNVTTLTRARGALFDYITEDMSFVENTILGRTGKLMVEWPFYTFEVVYNHELGHITRNYENRRKFNNPHMRFGFSKSEEGGLFQTLEDLLTNPWGDSWAGKYDPNSSYRHRALEAAGGMEITQLTAKQTFVESFRKGVMSVSDAIWRGFNQYDTARYILSTREREKKYGKNYVPSGDVDAYWYFMLNEYNGDPGFTKEDMRDLAFWSAVPGVIESVAIVSNYLLTGKKLQKIPPVWLTTEGRLTPTGIIAGGTIHTRPQEFMSGVPFSYFAVSYEQGKGEEGTPYGGAITIGGINLTENVGIKNLMINYFRQNRTSGYAIKIEPEYKFEDNASVSFPISLKTYGSVLGRQYNAGVNVGISIRKGFISKGFPKNEIETIENNLEAKSGEIVAQNQLIVQAVKETAEQILNKLPNMRETITLTPEEKTALNSAAFRAALMDPEKAFDWFETIVEGEEKYFLGAQSALAVDLIEFLKKKDPEEKEKLLAEYVVHEALEKTSLKHEEIITITTKLFHPKSSAKLAAGKLKHKKTPLGKVLREFIDNKSAESEPVQKKVETRPNLEKKEPLDTVDKITANAEKTIPLMVHALTGLSEVARKDAAASGDKKDEKIYLVIDNELGNGKMNALLQDYLKTLSKLSNNNDDLKRFLNKLEVISGEGNVLAGRLNRIEKPENVIVIAKNSNKEYFADLAKLATIVGIDDSELGETDFLPLPQIILFTISRHMGWKKSLLKQYYNMIPYAKSMEELTPENRKKLFNADQSTFIIKLIPPATPFAAEDLEKIMQAMHDILIKA